MISLRSILRLMRQAGGSCAHFGMYTLCHALLLNTFRFNHRSERSAFANRKVQHIAAALILLVIASPALGKDYRLQTLEDAHTAFRSATNSTGFASAAQQYEFLINEESIRNGPLFYTLGNSWFMAGDMGRAILNYRRAEKYMPDNADLKHNLKSAMELRTDLIPEQEPHPLTEKLLGWHLKTTTGFRWWLFILMWFGLWGSWFWLEQSPRKEARISLVITGILSVTLLSSLITESVMKRKADPGVITAKEVVARKGDGNMYAPAFLDPLHSGTEFQCLENRDSWWHIRLVDGQTCWIPAQAAQKISM